MIVFDKVQHFYQEKTLAAFLMVIGLVDVDVGQIEYPSWDVFSSLTLLNLAEISAFLINLALNRFQIIMITWGTGTRSLGSFSLGTNLFVCLIWTSEAVKLYQKPISFWSYSALFFKSIKHVSAGDLIKSIKKINAENCS